MSDTSWKSHFTQPISGFDRVKGEFTSQEQSVSYSDWLEMHPTVKWSALAGLALGAIALLGIPLFNDGELF